MEQLNHDLDEKSKEQGREEAQELSDRINQTFDKIKVVYPHIKSLECFQKSRISELLSHPKVRDVLSTTKSIANSEGGDFSATVKPYIDSDAAAKEELCHWPLVKLVKLFLKSEILETGITFVDLPGSMDSNAARSSIAEKYMKELKVSCIVGPANRGISEQGVRILVVNLACEN